MSEFVLVMVLAIGQSSSTSQHPLAATSVAFSSKERCEAALENIRLKINKAYVVVLTCERK